ncbi:FtsL-like putative cell division protein [Galbibacter sp. EGI 63066]|uniref:FtsL-like putative cell division protein n=1 Tax=Galbibacter sp. EGI 63066 TaxID=2993559 RepID=UPI00224975C6|nr:FtsL-like putative cell division protein [Galbibacter sp. EGI 63066]MCX2680443.1 FtsL-like putative cell division protein [Galbibacter sp. EGI 63066]
MKKGILDLLKGKFLVSEDSVKNWRFMLFVSVLAVVMISSAHRADKKVHELAKLNDEVLELRSEFVDVRTKVQQVKLESNVGARVSASGLKPSLVPPKKIMVADKK